MKIKTKFILLFSFSCFLLLNLFLCARNQENKPNESQDSNNKAKIPFEGKIIFQSNFDGDNEIYLLTSESLLKLTDNSWEDTYPVWSPDGKRIAFSANPEGNFDIFIMNSDGSEISAVTSFPQNELEPTWFPDGKQLAFSRELKKIVGKGSAIFSMNIQTKNAKRIIPRYKKKHGISHISPVSPLITITAKRTFGWDVAIYDRRENRVKFLEEKGKSCRARFSRDGKKLAYVSSTADGKGDIWIMNPDGSGKKRMTIRDNTYDYFPSWSPDGNYIVFNSSTQHDHNGDWKLFLINVKTGETQLLFDSPGNDVFHLRLGILECRLLLCFALAALLE